MGCARSKEGNGGGLCYPSGPLGMISLRSQRSSEADQRLAQALRAFKQRMDAEEPTLESFSFTKIILKLGTVERVLRRVKAVFQSVDEGKSGRLTRKQLKDGLHMVKVDLGEEWQDADIDECLEHLRAPQIGLPEFVVMLAIGRVCKPALRSAIFTPCHEVILSAAELVDIGVSSRGLSLSSRGPVMERIDEDDVPAAASGVEKRPLGSSPSANAGARAATGRSGKEAHGEDSAEAIDEKEPQGICADEFAIAVGGGQPHVGGDETGGTVASPPAWVEEESRALLSVGTTDLRRSAISPVRDSSDAAQAHQQTASAGPGGLPRANSWVNLKWARIPSLGNLEKPVGDAYNRIRSGSSKPPGDVANVVDAVRGGGGDGDDDAEANPDARSVKYVLDLFIAAYFQFDTTGQGYMTKKVVENKLRQAERESGNISLLDQRRWKEVSWDGDRLYFQEFIHVFAQWLGLLEDDDDLTVWSRSGSRSGVATAKGFDNGFGSIAVNPSFRNPRLSAVTLPGSFSDGSSRVSGTSEMHKDDSVCQISEMSYVE